MLDDRLRMTGWHLTMFSQTMARRCFRVSILLIGPLLVACTANAKLDLAPLAVLPIVQPALQARPGMNEVSIARPQDLRSNRTVAEFNYGELWIGHATITTSSDPALWVGNGIADGLENNGYRVLRVETISSAKTPLAIEVALMSLSSAPQTGFFSVTASSNLTVRVGVYRERQLITTREYRGEASQVLEAVGPRHLQATTNASLEDLLRKAIPDLCANFAAIRDSASRARPEERSDAQPHRGPA